jgi:hypothetical protein
MAQDFFLNTPSRLAVGMKQQLKQKVASAGQQKIL